MIRFWFGPLLGTLGIRIRPASVAVSSITCRGVFLALVSYRVSIRFLSGGFQPFRRIEPLGSNPRQRIERCIDPIGTLLGTSTKKPRTRRSARITTCEVELIFFLPMPDFSDNGNVYERGLEKIWKSWQAQYLVKRNVYCRLSATKKNTRKTTLEK